MKSVRFFGLAVIILCLAGLSGLVCRSAIAAGGTLAEPGRESTPPAAPEEKFPPGAKLARLEATPPSLELKQPFAYRQIILTGILESGERLDITRMVEVQAPANQRGDQLWPHC